MPAAARQVSSFEDSFFCQRLNKLAKLNEDNETLANLVIATRKLLKSATSISKQIVRFLPQFTSHDEIHLWNVLGFMEQLAGGAAGIDKMSAGDCAMAVWAAFIHDLGMVLEAGELAAIDRIDEFDTEPNDQQLPTDERVLAWRAYREGHEHWDSIRKDPNSPTSRMRLGLIRAAYIRDSHAREDAHTEHCRIADWLKFLADGDRLILQALDDFAVSDQLVRVAVSHNQDIHWLERQLREQLNIADPHADLVDGDLGTVHWTWIGWLLRLADVFDCDKSRTPKILFDHGGITDSRSQTEWQKHLAIPSPPLWPETSKAPLQYICRKSPSPVVEKAIHQIIGWMNEEIEKVRMAQVAAVCDPPIPPVDLPRKAEVDIKQREGGYIYHDMEFRLDRDAVVELLMGESLYGGPELALRELVQNALDAVHLRDQRNKLAEKLISANSPEKPRQPHEPWFGVKPGVEVTWGEEKGRRYIRVTDNGVGMTVGTMRKFLTQIGKSYYKSDDFRAEQEMMRRHGILCNAISQFGIGFLSVFMLADHVTIHTRPVGAEDKAPADPRKQETERFPFCAEIHGPHGLLAFYPDSAIRRSGTTVTVWLKDEFVLSPWNRDQLLTRLRTEFYEIDVPKRIKDLEEESAPSAKPARILDPGFEIGRFIVWPLYPVRLGPQGSSSLVLSDAFHFHELVPLDVRKIRAESKSWAFDCPEIDALSWQTCDWLDETGTANGITGTGSRIRVVVPHPHGSIEHSLSPNELGRIPDHLPSQLPRITLFGVAERTLPSVSNRFQCLVNGVRIVPGLIPSGSARDCQLVPILKQMPVVPGMGAYVWIDLRGAAMPQLRADRSAPTRSQSSTGELKPLMDRWVADWPATLPNWLCASVYCRQLRRPEPVAAPQSRLLLENLSLKQSRSIHVIELALDQCWYRELPDDQRNLFSRDFAGSLARDFTHSRDFNHSHEHYLHLARSLARALARSRSRTLGLDFGLTLDTAIARVRDVDKSRRLQLAAYLAFVWNHLASEGLWSNFSSSHPVLEVNGHKAQIHDLYLVGPLHVVTKDSRATKWIEAYDLCAPFTGIPLRALRDRFHLWNRERHWRAFMMLPLLLGGAPSLKWRNRFRNDHHCDHLMVFMPHPSQTEWLFDEHTPEEWSQGSASAIWDLKTGRVIYADGIHTEQSLRKHGMPLRDWLDVPESGTA